MRLATLMLIQVATVSAKMHCLEIKKLYGDNTCCDKQFDPVNGFVPDLCKATEQPAHTIDFTFTGKLATGKTEEDVATMNSLLKPNQLAAGQTKAKHMKYLGCLGLCTKVVQVSSFPSVEHASAYFAAWGSEAAKPSAQMLFSTIELQNILIAGNAADVERLQTEFTSYQALWKTWLDEWKLSMWTYDFMEYFGGAWDKTCSA